MPDRPKTANTQDLANTEYDAERWARVGAEREADLDKETPTTEEPEVGLSQKGSGADAVTRKETDV